MEQELDRGSMLEARARDAVSWLHELFRLHESFSFVGEDSPLKGEFEESQVVFRLADGGASVFDDRKWGVCCKPILTDQTRHFLGDLFETVADILKRHGPESSRPPIDALLLNF